MEAGTLQLELHAVGVAPHPLCDDTPLLGIRRYQNLWSYEVKSQGAYACCYKNHFTTNKAKTQI